MIRSNKIFPAVSCHAEGGLGASLIAKSIIASQFSGRIDSLASTGLRPAIIRSIRGRG